MFDLIKRYPWLPSLEEYYSDISSKDPIEFINEVFTSEKSEILKTRILNIFNAAFDNIEMIPDYRADDINIYLYILLKILLYVLDIKTISNRVANLYAKTTNKELNEDRESNLYEIYRDLKLDVLYEENPVIYKKRIVKDQQEIFKTNFKIHYIDYLRLASHLKDEHRKLINSALLLGYVYTNTDNLNRLIQEYVRMKFITQNIGDPTNLNSFKEKLFEVEGFKELYDTITAIWASKKEEFEYTIDISFKEGTDMSDIFPPCIIEILSKAQEGQNLLHTERLYILWFLNALEYPEDEIINVFSTLPDFNREKTEYQVKYAIKKGYTPYSCKSLKSYNLCMAKKYDNKLCLNGYFSNKLQEDRMISHPLFYVQYKKFVKSIKLKPEKNNSNENNE